MGAKESEAMKRARELILVQGMNQNQAAKAVGLTRGAISRSAWYRKYVEDKEKNK
jgi:DNA-binding transcriptional regulator LsrR (DeoR family)